VLSGQTTTCGRCNEISADEMSTRKFGKLRIKIPRDILPGSNKKTEWICDCGNEIKTRVNYVTSGDTTNCGRCNEISAEEISKKKFGKLHIITPQNISPGSHKKITWICDCGNETIKQISSVISGITKSCGKCDIILTEDIALRKFGKLRIKIPRDMFSKSHKKVACICDCGKEINIKANNLFSGNTKSCGFCNIISSQEISKMKFNRLRIKESKDIKPQSHRKLEWTCDCGNETIATVYDVVGGHTKSCGRCSDIVKIWYVNNKDRIRALKCPISIIDFPAGGPIPLETIEKSHEPFKAICISCNSVYYPRLNGIKQGESLTCGCSTNRISFAQKEITDFIISFGFDVQNEYEVNELKYDIYIPSKNLLIEYNGLKWHSLTGSKERDIKKYENAIANKFSYLMIFEDEWVHGQSKVKNLISNKLNSIRCESLRPHQCEIKLISSIDSDPFYDQFHYIGPCKAKINYGVYYEDKLIACMSFKKPTRQSKHDFELVRMASDPKYRVHGIWSKLLKQFIQEISPKSIVSFSDNRLFSGEVYEKMGFKLNKSIRPDYYWCKSQRRFHKSGLRKTKEEKLTGLTETQLRTAQGYKKIWDLGKKRFILYNSRQGAGVSSVGLDVSNSESSAVAARV
jgi:GNAT superfamily N-acetyltransferase